jgi:hypothetical protein
VINKQSSDSSLENITDAKITIPWLGRMLGFGDLTFMTASEAGIEDLRALRDPIGFKKALMDAKTERMISLNTPRVLSPPIGAAARCARGRPRPAPAWRPQPRRPRRTKTLASLAALRDGAIRLRSTTAKQELLDRI